MITAETNPPWMDPAAYIEFLNRSCPGQWDSVSYEWYQRRAFNGRAADIVVRADERRVLAGGAFGYRQLLDDAGRVLEVCILGAVTTLPEERGRGHYGALLQSAVGLCRERSCAALIGFVTRGNFSGQGLIRLGALAIPSFYITSGDGRPASAQSRHRIVRPWRTPDPRHLQARAERRGGVRFRYVKEEDWREQFLERPNPVHAVRISHDSTALIESVGITDRVQWLDCPGERTTSTLASLAAASRDAGRRLFLYSMDRRVAEAARRLQLEVRSGYLMLLPIDAAAADWEAMARASWHVQSGDRL